MEVKTSMPNTLRGRRGQDEVDEVREVVQGTLHTVHSPSLCFQNVLLKKLGHSEVKGPKTYRAAVWGEKKWKEMSETSGRILALALTGTVTLGK